MFQLNQKEKEKVVAICDHLAHLKFSHQLPYAFTEHGVTMLSSVLKSERAVQMNIFIIRAFIYLRRMIVGNNELRNKVDRLELDQIKQNIKLDKVYSYVKEFMDTPLPTEGKFGLNVKT